MGKMISPDDKRKVQKRVERTCETCGAKFIGVVRARFCASCARKRDAESRKRCRARLSNNPLPIGTCKACDNIRSVNEEGFCKPCVREGWDEVYKLRGKPHDTFYNHAKRW